MKLLTFLRSCLATFLFPFTVLIIGPMAILFHALFNKKSIDDQMVILWGKVCCFLSGVQVTVEGLENIPHSGCVFLFNHSSFFDIFAVAGYVPGIRFGAKIELFKIPVLSQTMTAMGTLPIARANREEVYKVYEDAKERFSKGHKFVLSPEGGRFYGPKLFPFKAGPFMFAMSAQVPVVPIVLIGAHEVLPKGGFLFNKNQWKAKIHLKILSPISTVGYSVSNRHDLQKIVYDKMNTEWTKQFSTN